MVKTIAAWNLRGLNTPKKQKLVQQWISKNSLNIVGLLETRIRPANMEAVKFGLGLANWKFISNAHMAPLCRILVGWNTERADISMVHSASQWLTCDALSLGDGSTVRITCLWVEYPNLSLQPVELPGGAEGVEQFYSLDHPRRFQRHFKHKG
ncbi:hypothetical protein OIU85_019839 [Salix viminalis]|uniref:Endonuclease/exonuclease/phosphatase domain-containing protein n=1 Tax=Salix viminalis TaxID=40686 RepID=A0A9Q0ZKJ7_SALVM|nr:hypothetical protein OIU85_019839 [Salix viminalis]